MATMLYPPYIDGKIPTQIGDELVIPYEHNRVTSDYTGFKLLLKTVATNRQIVVLSDEGEDAKFTLSENILTNGQYYKAQLAYYKDTTIGPYSTVGVFKYLSETPTVSIEGLQTSAEGEGLNNIQQEYKGTYTCTGDPTEKVYEYKFDLYELGSDEIIDTTGWQLHSYEDDPSTTADTSSDFYSCSIDLSANKVYKIQYNIKTINNLILSSPSYLLSNNASYLPFQWNLELKAYADIDNACNKLILKFNDFQQRKVQGQFKIFRSSSKDNHFTFLELGDLYINEVIKANDKTYDLFEDFLIEHGFKYRYYIQQYYDTKIDNENKRLMTEKIPSNEIYSEFEDMFLCEYDKENQKVTQLKIKFNPKVSSFKTTTLESKTDTVGGKYPFFFRNGRTAYKDFPISGLISYFMDEQGSFCSSSKPKQKFRTATPSADNNILNDQISINLTSDNIAKEREFRNKVVNWLNNGHTKIFKSSTEGLFLVRLMNISLSPNDTVGRMLYTFNCNAYEIDTITQKSLKDLGYIGFVVKRVDEYLIKIRDVYTNNPIILDGESNMARIEDAQPGTEIKFTFEDKTTTTVTVGYTGVYEVNIVPSNLLTKVQRLSFNDESSMDYELVSKNNPGKNNGDKFCPVYFVQSGYANGDIPTHENFFQENRQISVKFSYAQKELVPLKLNFSSAESFNDGYGYLIWYNGQVTSATNPLIWDKGDTIKFTLKKHHNDWYWEAPSSMAKVIYGYNNDSENFALLNADKRKITNYATYQHISQYYGNEKSNIEERTDIINEIKNKFISTDEVNSKEVLLNKIMYLRFQAKEIEGIYKHDNSYYKDQALTVSFIPNNPTVIYYVLNYDKYYVYINELKEIEEFDNSIYNVVMDDNTISLESQKRIIYTINDTDAEFFNLQKIILGAGVYADISCLATEQTLGEVEPDA